MKRIVTVSIVASGLLMGGGYKLPEHSLNSTALAGAYTANTIGADTAYANPANMAFMEDKSYIEGGLMLAHLPAIENTSLVDPSLDGKSKKENKLIPSGHYMAPANGDLRWGVSMVSPGGLSKRWETRYQKASAEEFSLRTIELNPSVSYKVSDNFSIGGGVRFIYSDGVVKSDAFDFTGAPISRDMEGDTFGVGYNLALAFRPSNDVKIGITYRSKIDLDLEGDADLSFYNGTLYTYSGSASVEVPLPAVLNLAIAKTWNDNFTLELNYERVYWSALEAFDFEFSDPTNPAVIYFGTPLEKNWKDTNVFRVGAAYVPNDRLTLMAGFAIDETPVPDSTIGFELPDSDAKVYSLGFRYKQSENLSWGMALLYDDKESRTALNSEHILPGEFTKGGALLTTIGISYEY